MSTTATPSKAAKAAAVQPADDVAAEPAAELAEPSPRLSLKEFCERLSEASKRVELIAAFNADEDAAGNLVDVESAYRSRFDAFKRRPA